MKEMTPSAVRERLLAHSALIVPVGTTEQHGPHLPLGCDTIIVERLADDLSAQSGVLRTPTVEYGVHTPTRSFPGGAAVRRKTLHRTMNELIESWEEGAGVRQFLILTAQNNDAHQEALSTIRADLASVVAVDVFAMDFSTVIERPGGPVHGGELDTSLMLYIAPDLVHMELAQDFALPPGRGGRHYDPSLGRELPAGSPGSVGYPSLASAQKGERVYSLILERVSRCLVQC
jgi:creatinine amidohydrolase